MKLLYLIVFTVVVLSSAPIFAEVKVTRAQWSSEMKNMLPAAFCRDGTYFRSCFKIDAAACHSEANTATASCLRQFHTQIPATLIQPRDGTEWGTKIGTCAGALFDQGLKNKKIDNRKCNDPSQWQ